MVSCIVCVAKCHVLNWAVRNLRKISVVIGIIVLAASTTLVFAHGGGLNTDGCHNERRTSGYHCHRPQTRTRPVVTPRPTPRPTAAVRTYQQCDAVPTHHLRFDTQGRVAVQRHLVPTQPDNDRDGLACGGQLEHKRYLLAPSPSPTPRAPTVAATPRTSKVLGQAAQGTEVPTAQIPNVPRRAKGEIVRYTPTNEVYGACRAKFPYTHLTDCNVDYDFLMLFWLSNAV